MSVPCDSMKTLWLFQVSFGPPTRGHTFGSSEREILAPRLDMGVREDWGSELADRLLLKAQPLQAPPLCV